MFQVTYSKMKVLSLWFVLLVILTKNYVLGRLEAGIFENTISIDSELQILAFQRTAFAGTRLEIKLKCHDLPDVKIKVAIRSSPCYREFIDVIGSASKSPRHSFDAVLADNLRFYFTESHFVLKKFGYSSLFYYVTPKQLKIDCLDHYVHLPGVYDQHLKKIDNTKPWMDVEEAKGRKRRSTDQNQSINSSAPYVQSDLSLKTDHPAFLLDESAVYLVMLKIFNPKNSTKNNLSVLLEWKTDQGYLSPVDSPLLSFYGFSCILYAVYGFSWLYLCFKRFNELLRIQFWIGAVIGLGMVEKAAFYFEYQKVKHTGYENASIIQFAELARCLKKTLSIILLIIISVGFGVVKPRLGSTLNKVVGIGLLYFGLCGMEAMNRASTIQHDSPQKKQLIGLPLVVLQLVIFYWIFTALWDTMRNLHLRRNDVKLAVYRRLTVTLVCCLFISVLFMLWSVLRHQFNACLKDWQNLWLDVAVWHILFSVILLVIMILLRPSQNNQRFAFTPLLDQDEDQNEEYQVQGSYDLQKRQSPHGLRKKDSLEDDLKWVDQHIPDDHIIMESGLILDDEDVNKIRFELTKIQ